MTGIVGPPGSLGYAASTRIDIAGTHAIDVTDGADQVLTATGDCVLSLATPVDAWCWRVTVSIDPAGHTVTLPASPACRWGSGVVPDVDGITDLTLDYIPTLGWSGHVGGLGMAVAS